MHHACSAGDKSGNSNSNAGRGEEIFDRDPKFLEQGKSKILSLWCKQFPFYYLGYENEWYTALHVAFRGGILPEVILSDRGNAIDETDRAGNTPLHHAVCEGYDDGVALLLERGAKMSRKNND